MNRSSLTLSLLFFLSTGLCQSQNLVPDPTLENYTSPFCGIMEPSNFNSTMIDWVNPTQASPALFFTNNDVTCYNHQPISAYSGPIGIKGSQLPKSGTAMAGIWVYTIDGFNQRQYIQTELSSALIVGNSYVISFYVSLADSMEFSIDKLGAHLSLNEISSLDDQVMDYTPQVLSNAFIDNSTDWVLISDTIVADEAHSYLTIGNFFDDSNTNTMVNPLGSGAAGTYGAYYFVDDVSVSPLTPVSVQDFSSEDVLVYPTLVNDVLYIERTDHSHEARFKIFNSLGQMLLNERSRSALSTLDISAFAKGSYLVSVEINGQVFTQKVIK